MDDIFDVLRSAKMLSLTTAKVVKKFCLKWKVSGFHGLLETNVFDEGHLADILARLLKLDRVYSIVDHESAALARRKVPYELALEWECLPNLVNEGGQVELVVADPTHKDCLAFLNEASAGAFRLVVGTRSEILKAIDDYYPLEEQLIFSPRKR